MPNVYPQDRVTALQYYPKADSIVHSIHVNPAFLEINCDSVDVSGRALTWSYVYDSLKITISSDSIICEPGEYWWTGMSAILSFVLDSDSAMYIAEKNGGSDFRNKYPDYTITEVLNQASASPYPAWTIGYRGGGAYWWIDVDANNGQILWRDDSSVKDDSQTSSFVLYQNYPNPFNSSTTIKFTVHKPTHTKVTIYNLIGQKIMSLLDEELQAGLHSLIFESNGMPSGIYLYRLETPEFLETKKLIIQD